MDIMCDIETLGTLPDSAIISIGAVVFDYNNAENPIYSKFYRIIAPDLQRYSVTYETIKWWMNQSEAARSVFNFANDTHIVLDTASAMYDFRNWLSTNSFQNIWAHSTCFDIIILENAFRTEGHQIPWSHRQVRDTRNILELTGVRISNTGINHNALDDATAQALAVIEAHQKIYTWKLKAENPIIQVPTELNTYAGG
jgi:exodeoxyribonuclease VIII